jgi:uncharacterized protein
MTTPCPARSRMAIVAATVLALSYGIACNRAPATTGADNGKVQKVFGGAQVQEVYRLRLDRDDLLLEAVTNAAKEHNIQDGAVLTAVGSVQDCTYHAVKSTAATAEDQVINVKGPIEILSADGIIAAGEPHIHITLSTIEKGAFGGHLEKGCRVLYRAELTIAKFSGLPLARKLNREGTPLLQPK